MAVNCAGLTETLLESELFGHVKGSFTGAYRDKPGKLQLAHGGTLFLDEVGEMSLRMQALLLRFLENGEIQPVGSDRTQGTVDVRVISATNRQSARVHCDWRFREDLLYRLSVIHLHIPPLRSRPEDIRAARQRISSRSRDAAVTLRPEAWKVLRAVSSGPATFGSSRTSPSSSSGWRRRVDPSRHRSCRKWCAPFQVADAAARERRRQLADDLYQALVSGGYSFWDHIYPLFLGRDITRHDMRELFATRPDDHARKLSGAAPALPHSEIGLQAVP